MKVFGVNAELVMVALVPNTEIFVASVTLNAANCARYCDLRPSWLQVLILSFFNRVFIEVGSARLQKTA